MDLFDSRRQKLSLNEDIHILSNLVSIKLISQKKQQLLLPSTSTLVDYSLCRILERISSKLNSLDFNEDLCLTPLISALLALTKLNQNIPHLLPFQICDAIVHERYELLSSTSAIELLLTLHNTAHAVQKL